MKNTIKFLGFIALVAVIAMTAVFSGCEPESEPESGPARKSIRVTGLPEVQTYKHSSGPYMAEYWLIRLFNDDGVKTIGTHGGSILHYDDRTIDLEVPNETIKNDAGFTVPKPWTGSGKFYIQLSVCRENDVIQKNYYYTDGKTYGELGITDSPSDNLWHQKLPEYNITEKSHTIPFSKFSERSNGVNIGGGGGGNAKKITITGMTGKTGVAYFGISSNNPNVNDAIGSSDGGMGATISNNSVTFALLKPNGDPFTGSGSYYLMLSIAKDFSTASSESYFYTDGKTVEQLGITSNMTVAQALAKLPKYNISSATSTIAFNKFVVLPDWW